MYFSEFIFLNPSDAWGRRLLTLTIFHHDTIRVVDARCRSDSRQQLLIRSDFEEKGVTGGVQELQKAAELIHF